MCLKYLTPKDTFSVTVIIIMITIVISVKY